eukprot:TRINITY_DN3599_c0_g2_i2.p1 TRINITY_DN3599_c0_g2~~TRINITY_DN3599_c0_g2_i2.p1  ORF type:complete len:372 (+),score=40.77 TRINITY_DN3599_c0_g2_i2:170-1285(+)
MLVITIAALLLTIVYGQEECGCYDIPPPESQHTCKEQKDWGKCSEDWMLGWCQCACGTCQDKSPSSELMFEPSFSMQRLFDDFDIDHRNKPEYPEGVHSPIRLNYTNYPFKVIGQLGEVCTAALIGPCQKITAAHCLMEPETNTWWSDFDAFFPGRNGRDSWNPYGEAAWVKTFVPEQWKQGLGTPYDVGLVLLDRRIGDEVGWFQLDYIPYEIVLSQAAYGDLEGVVKETLTLLSAEFQQNQQKLSDVQKAELGRMLRTRRVAMNLAGYPSDDHSGAMIHEYCRGVTVDYSQGMLLLHICEAGKGVSGAPLWVNHPEGNRTIKAIHGGEVYLKDNDPPVVGSYAVMITPTIYNQIMEWMEYDARCYEPVK